MDTPVTTKIAEIFVKHKVEFHGADTWVLLLCDNLKSHGNDQVRFFWSCKGALVLLY